MLFFILGCFLPFYPCNSPKNEYFKKIKKEILEISLFYTCAPKIIIIIIYTVSEIWHMMDVIVIFHFSLLFTPLPPNLPQKVKIFLKKWKTPPLKISSFGTRASKIMIICYNIPEICSVTNVVVIFDFGLFFALLPP